MHLRSILMAGFSAILSICQTAAQETCPLPIMVSVDNSSGVLSESNVRLLDTKLQQLVASRGYGSSAELSHLCLKAVVSDSGDKQVVSGTRPVVAGSYGISLVLTNLLSGENFGADNISVKGVGNTESAMLQKAMARINPTNPELQKFLTNARVKVFDYYRSHIPHIIGQARAMSQRGNYDKALYLLSTVPPCVEGYDSIENAMLATYQEYLDVDCNEKLLAARAIWSSTQTEEGAKGAAAYLAAIDSRSGCFSEARALLSEIAGLIDENLRRVIAREDEDRALEHELIRGEEARRNKQQDNEFQLRQQEIEAIREISQAYVQSVIGGMMNRDKTSRDDSLQQSPREKSGDKKGAPVIIVNN